MSCSWTSLTPRPCWRCCYDADGSERGPVALPVFKIGRCLLAGQAGFDSQALPPAFGLELIRESCPVCE